METSASNVSDKSAIKELILGIKNWFRLLAGKWMLLCIAAIGGGIIGLLIAISTKPKYESRITFVLEDSKSAGGLSAYAGVAAQFGIDLGGGSGGVFQGDNILLLLKSKLLVRKALLSKYDENGSKSLADIYLEIGGLNEKWKSKTRLANIKINPFLPEKKMKYSILQDSVIEVIYEKIIEENLKVEKIDKKLSFIEVNCVTKDELFSKFFVEKLVSEATDLYILTKTKRSKANVEKLSARADSLERLMNAKTYYVANSQDLNLNPVRKMGTVNTELASRDRLILQTIYGEVVKNLEVAKMTLSQETPIIQIIDSPNLPLHKIEFKLVKSSFLGLFITSFLFIIIITIQGFYKNIMS